ncbi:MAG TPA: PAS domain S-box protein [Candidatus Limnocylindrales bacterium]|nr:PAS domain S-box protein [Candidatus Limnocylindrales bacterium]
MEPIDHVIEENRRLRRTMSDLVALSTLPAVWFGQPLEQIAHSLADILVHTLSLDLLYLRLSGLGAEPTIEVARGAGGEAPSDVDAVRRAVAPVLQDAGDSPSTIVDPFGAGSLHVAVTRFAIRDDLGVLVTASRNASFPSERDRLLLGVGANQTAIIVQRRRAENYMRRSEERLRAVVETTPACIKVVAPDGTLVDMNTAGLSMVDAERPEDVIGRCVYDLMTEESRERFRDFNERICRGEKGSLRFEIRGLKGSRRHMETHAAPLQGHGGLLQLAVTLDVTERRRAEHDSKLRARVLESMAEGVSVTDESGIIVYTNPAEDRMFGYEHGEFIGKHVSVQNAYPPEENQRVIGEVIARLSTAGEWSGEFSNRRKDGSEFITHARITALEMGERRYFVCVQEDITERKRVERELQDARARLDAALAAGAIVTWTWDIGSNRLFADANLARLFNLAARDANGAALDRYIEAIHPDDVARVTAALSRSVTEGDDYEADYRIVQQDGSIRWVAARGRAERDASGRAVRMPGVLVDITDRKMLETELRLRVAQLAEADRRKDELLSSLRESEEKLRLLADTIPQLAWMAHPDGHVFWFNRQWYEYTGTSPEQMEGWGWQSVHDPHVLPEVLEQWNDSIATGKPFEMVFPLRNSAGTFRPFLTRVNPLRDDSGRILYWFGTNTDISEIKRMEDALREADRRKDEFLATLAHELRNPLAPIRNSLQIMKMPGLDEQTFRQSRDMMERQVHHLVRLVDDLLDVSRVMRGKIDLRREPVELGAIIARAVETVEASIRQKGLELEIQVQPEPIFVDADPVRMTQVVGNLLGNAAKYTEPGGHVRVIAERVGANAILRVRDDGIGIAPEMLPRIFDLFVQADHAMAWSQGGLGIGLTLVRNLVEMHGGTVEADSAGVGRGTEFVVRLPALDHARIARDSSLGNGAGDADKPVANGHRLLVVDDNKDAATSLAMLLRMQGHAVRVVHDGAAALDVVERFRPALVFLDIGMPGMDGYEVARRIRQQPGTAETVLAALTGWGQQEDRRLTAEAGFDYHLVKPPEPTEIASLLARLPSKVGVPNAST